MMYCFLKMSVYDRTQDEDNQIQDNSGNSSYQQSNTGEFLKISVSQADSIPRQRRVPTSNNIFEGKTEIFFAFIAFL